MIAADTTERFWMGAEGVTSQFLRLFVPCVGTHGITSFAGMPGGTRCPAVFGATPGARLPASIHDSIACVESSSIMIRSDPSHRPAFCNASSMTCREPDPSSGITSGPSIKPNPNHPLATPSATHSVFSLNTCNRIAGWLRPSKYLLLPDEGVQCKA
jgi:hypothetical protein